MNRALRRKMWRFALAVACAAAAVVGVASVVLPALRAAGGLRDTNRKTLGLIQCRETEKASFERDRQRCDISRVQNDLTFEPADYVLVHESGAIVWARMQYPRFWINRVEVAPWRAIREPTTVEAVTGAQWRLYGERARQGTRSVEIVVGYLEEANWLTDAIPADAKKDTWLKEEVNRIRLVVERGAEVEAWRINSRLDGWAVLDSATGVPVVWNGDLPGRFPGSLEGGNLIHSENGHLYLVRQERVGNLVAVALAPIGDIWSTVTTVMGTFILVVVAAYWMCRTRFRRQFVMAGRRPGTVAEALSSGETTQVEFKRDAGNRESVLRAITAFANSNDGTIFVGITDDCQVEGLNLPTAQERDRFVISIQNAIRERIRPNPFIDIAFEEVKGKMVARIFVPRGDQPLYCYDGRPYVREGPQSVVADGIKVAKIVMEFA
jgi:hypothetical protein